MGEGKVDLASLGLKCGLEIHQQLDTGKLFCRCPSVIREDAPDFTLTRHLRASAGETGVVDAAAAQEQVKAKSFHYQGYQDSTCLVELDEEPPHDLNGDALHATLQVAKLVKSEILDEVHVMRKTVVDGSNTAGFQRTALVAIGGKLLEQDVKIQTICLEEDAAKIISRTKTADTYNLSRLGIPLIEIATDPDIRSPEQAGATAAEIGMIVRSTGKAKRGLGTIRQDLNVSIRDGARVEIKGAQDLQLIPDLVRNEMLRQHGLLQIKKELHARGINSVQPPAPHNLTPYFLKSKSGFVAKGFKRGEILLGLALPGFDKLLGRELYQNYRLGTELAGYAKAFGFGGIIHSDEELKKYKFSSDEIAKTKRRLSVKKDDAFILILGEEQRAHDLVAFLLIPRLERLLHGIPKEVRKANADGTTTYLRPMPGAARMYPETDIRRVETKHEKVTPPKLLKDQEAELVTKYKIAPNHAKELLRANWNFPAYVNTFSNLPPLFLAKTLLETPKEIKKRYGKEIDLKTHERTLHEILATANAKRAPKEAVFELLADVAKGEQPHYELYKAVDVSIVEQVVKDVIKADPKAPINALMGEAMKRLRGKANGKDVMAALKKYKK